jgi:hypothetical protein
MAILQIKENARDFVILTEDLILGLFVDLQSWDIVSLGVIRLQDGAVIRTFSLPFSYETRGLRFIEDSVHSCGGFTHPDTPYIYNPGADRVMVLCSPHPDSYTNTALTVAISALHLLSYTPLSPSRQTQPGGSSKVRVIMNFTSLGCVNDSLRTRLLLELFNGMNGVPRQLGGSWVTSQWLYVVPVYSSLVCSKQAAPKPLDSSISANVV